MTVQGPVKEQQPDGMSHGGMPDCTGRGGGWQGAAICSEAGWGDKGLCWYVRLKAPGAADDAGPSTVKRMPWISAHVLPLLRAEEGTIVLFPGTWHRVIHGFVVLVRTRLLDVWREQVNVGPMQRALN